MDSTYECISNLPSTATVSKDGMNDTMVLVARLDSAGLDSPAPAQISNSPRFAFVANFPFGFVKISSHLMTLIMFRPSMTLTAPSSPSLQTAGANSTFAVSEQMDMEDECAGVEQGQLASHGASLDSAGLTEVSFIAPPPGPSAR